MYKNVGQLLFKPLKFEPILQFLMICILLLLLLVGLKGARRMAHTLDSLLIVYSRSKNNILP